MKKIIRIHVTVIVFLVSVLAAALPAAAGTGGFSVNPLLPENQNRDTRGFFDLMVSPGQRQELTVTISNSNNTEIAVTIQTITATTNRNGIVNYTSADVSDETLRHSFANITTIPEETITIPANSSRQAVVILAVPEESFDGIILGSIRVLKAITEEERNAGGAIVNQYSYTVAVRLSQNAAEIETDFLLGSVEPTLVNHRASIVAYLRNPQPKLIKNVEAVARIYPLGSDTAIFESVKNDMEFAPNSIFPFSMVDQAGYGIRAGNYLAKIQVIHEGRTWDFEHEFEILATDADNINRNSVNQTQFPNEPAGQLVSGLGNLPIPTWALIAIIAGALLLIAAILLGLKKRKSDQGAYAEFEKRMQQLEQQRQQSKEPQRTTDEPKADQADMLKQLAAQMDEEQLKRLLEQMQQKNDDQ